MNISYFREFVSLIESINYLINNDFLWKIVREEGFVPNSFDLDVLLKIVVEHCSKIVD